MLCAPEDREKLSRIIYLSAESLRICGILLQPFMPSKMKELLDVLWIKDDARTYANAVLGSDTDYGAPGGMAGPRTRFAENLFPPLANSSD